MAASEHTGLHAQKSHPGKARAAKELATLHGLPDVSNLLRDLNEARKSEAYGDVTFPTGLDAEDVAVAVEEYIDAVDELLQR